MSVPEEHKEYWQNKAREGNLGLWELKDKITDLEQQLADERAKCADLESRLISTGDRDLEIVNGFIVSLHPGSKEFDIACQIYDAIHAKFGVTPAAITPPAVKARDTAAALLGHNNVPNTSMPPEIKARLDAWKKERGHELAWMDGLKDSDIDPEEGAK